MIIQGYRRSDSAVGIRNHLVVMPTVACAVGAAEAIAEVGRRVFARVMAAARGERTKAEVLGQREFAVGGHVSLPAGPPRCPAAR